MSLTYKQQLEDKRLHLRNQLIQAEWNFYNNVAEKLRKKLKQIEKQIEEL